MRLFWTTILLFNCPLSARRQKDPFGRVWSELTLLRAEDAADAVARATYLGRLVASACPPGYVSRVARARAGVGVEPKHVPGYWRFAGLADLGAIEGPLFGGTRLAPRRSRRRWRNVIETVRPEEALLADLQAKPEGPNDGDRTLNYCARIVGYREGEHPGSFVEVEKSFVILRARSDRSAIKKSMTLARRAMAGLRREDAAGGWRLAGIEEILQSIDDFTEVTADYPEEIAWAEWWQRLSAVKRCVRPPRALIQQSESADKRPRDETRRGKKR